MDDVERIKAYEINKKLGDRIHHLEYENSQLFQKLAAAETARDINFQQYKILIECWKAIGAKF